MSPPRIRTHGLNARFEAQQQQAHSSSWRGWLSKAAGRCWSTGGGGAAQPAGGTQQQHRVKDDAAGRSQGGGHAGSGPGDEECLSPLSQFFCTVDNPPDIYACLTLEGHCSVEELVGPMQHMADLHDRFKRRLVRAPDGSWHGEVLTGFRVASLMRAVTLPGPDPQAAFDGYMGKLMSEQPLGCDGLPPWDITAIHYASDPGRTDVLMRASHIIGDGALFMRLIKQIMQPLDAAARADYDDSIGAAPPGTHGVAAAPGDRQARPSSGSGGGGAGGRAGKKGGGKRGPHGSSGGGSSSSSSGGGSVSDTAGQGLQARGSSRASRLGDSMPQQQQSGIAQPHHHHHHQHGQRHRRQQPKWLRAVTRLLLAAWHQWTALMFAWITLIGPADPVTSLKAAPHECAGPRRWASVTICLTEFHRTAKLLGHSLNSLAVACLAGGIRRYLQQLGEVPATRVRLCGLVDTRSMPAGLLSWRPGRPASNNFSFVGVPLFTGDCPPLLRLARVGAALAWVRHSLVVPLALRTPRAIQMVLRSPAWSSWALLRVMPHKTSVCFSNMRGPRGDWALAGHRLLRLYNGVQPMAFGSFISLFSYGRGLTFTHTCFETKTRQPELLLQCMLQEYRVMRKAAGLSTADGSSGSDPGLTSGDGKIKAG